uniref:Integrase catalytic domain-containing protein n=1 Tax=Tanacetum cinerariifolium TaxID=118510 RepID=A0A699H0Z3_TANCI|nr:hypothetical protein [Tanacetum cinerariifolium]
MLCSSSMKKVFQRRLKLPWVLAIRKGRIQKDNKKSQGEKGKDKAKNKLAFAPKPKILSLPKRDNMAKDFICHQYKVGLKASMRLKHEALSLYVGNEIRTAVKAIRSFDIVLLGGLIIILDNCHFAPTITRDIVFYFNAIPRDGIYEIDMHDLYPNHDGILEPTHDESLKKCKSCKSGKIKQKPFSHQVERAKDLLGLIHTDACGPSRIMSREGVGYFITFIDDFSLYGYVNLMKHKHEVFETFKVFHNEVENQLGKKIKAIRFDRGGEYLSHEFVNHMKSCGYALESAARILNTIPTKKVDRMPYEIWHGKAPKLSYLRLWGCYYFYNLLENMIFVARDAKFFENSHTLQEVSGSHGFLKASGSDEIKKIAFTQNPNEPSVYLKASGINAAFQVLYLNDILIMGNDITMLQHVKSWLKSTFEHHPYHFTYPERRITMEEVLYKFIDEGKRQQEDMRAFIHEFKTTNKLLFKERNNSLSKLRFEVQGLLRVINNTPISKLEVEGVTTRGGKTMNQDVQDNDTNIHTKETLLINHNELVESNEVLTEDQPQKTNEPVVRPHVKLEEYCMITVNERCSEVLLNKLPLKEKDLGSFTIPCYIGQLNINNALKDLGASISLMPYTMYKKLGLEKPKATRMSLELADRSIQYPRGIVENVLIKVDKFVLLKDFSILDMGEHSRVPIILGRPFLATARAMIGVFNKKITLRVGEDEAILIMDQSYKRSPAEDNECYGVDDLDDAINVEAQELLANDTTDSFLLKGLEKSIEQSDLESCKCEAADDSDSIRRIKAVNMPYPIAQKTAEPNKVKRE